MTHDTTRIDQLFEDAHQILAIAQEVLQTTHAQSHNAIQERDNEIAQLRDRVYELELRLHHQPSPAGSDGRIRVDIHELLPLPPGVTERVASHA